MLDQILKISNFIFVSVSDSDGSDVAFYHGVLKGHFCIWIQVVLELFYLTETSL